MKNIQIKRSVLDNAAKGGKFFSVGFTKKDGSFREMTCKAYVEDAFTYGSANAKKNTCEGKENIYCVVDMGIENAKGTKGAFRNINLDTLQYVKTGKETITFKS